MPNPIGKGMKVEGAGENAGQQGAEFHAPSVAGTGQKARSGVIVFASGKPGDRAVRIGSGYGPIREASWMCGVPAW